MSERNNPSAPSKPALHPRSQHHGRYDFPSLIATHPELKQYVEENKYGNESINFFDPDSVKALNTAILKHFYGVTSWDIPEGFLCPPIPGRADYIHHAADLLADTNFGKLPSGKSIKCLDVGVGANCVYPIIGNSEYGWSFVGSDIDAKAIASANNIVTANSLLKGKVECRLQKNSKNILKGIIQADEQFDLVICNPPFHGSLAEAKAGTDRKLNNLRKGKDGKPELNFGGRGGELWTEGGEKAFILNMAEESAEFAKSCLWFTSLVSKEAHLNAIYRGLAKVGAKERRVIEMGVGNKRSRIVVWSFMSAKDRREWGKERWS